MSLWTERLKTSPVFQHLADLGPAIDAARDREGISAPDVESLERMRTVLSFVGQRLDGADGDLIGDGVLEAIDAPLTAAIEEVRTYVQDGSVQHLAVAQSRLDAVLGAFAGLVGPTKATDFKGLRSVVENYREAMTKQLEQFDAKAAGHSATIATLAGRIEEVTNAFDAEQKTLIQKVETFRTDVTTAQTALSVAYEGAEQRLGDGTKASLAEFKSAFDTVQKEFAEQRRATADEQQKAFRGLIAGYDASLRKTDKEWSDQLKTSADAHLTAQADLRKSYEEKAQSILATIGDHLGRVQELVGVIGDLGVTSGHKTAADDALKEVTFWQRVTLGAMLVLILFAGYTAIDYFHSVLNWVGLARRVWVSIAVGVLATYAASQASRYQQVERRNRKLELELKAIGPFLEPVAPEEREKFRLKIAERFFGREDGPSGEPGPATVFHVLKRKETAELFGDFMKTVLDRVRRP